MNDEFKAKREELKELSKLVKMKMQHEITDASTINEGLIEIYSNGKNIEFNTFYQWKEKGFSIVKGSKAYLVWGKPKKLPVKEPEDKEDEFKYWPVCYLFSSDQVK